MKLFKRKPKVKSYEFGIHEMNYIGERYVYTIHANSREEAFSMLIQYFYGEHKNQPVDSKHYDMTRPASNEWYVWGMPSWFGRTLSAKGRQKDYDELKKYAEKHNIKLKGEL